MPDYSGLVNIGGTSSLVSYNSIYDSGRSTIVIGGMDFKGHSDIQYNDVYNAGLLTKDLGIIYTANKDGQFVEIHHNLVHDNKSSHINPGIYLDSYTSNFIIHHNSSGITQGYSLIILPIII